MRRSMWAFVQLVILAVGVPGGTAHAQDTVRLQATTAPSANDRFHNYTANMRSFTKW